MPDLRARRARRANGGGQETLSAGGERVRLSPQTLFLGFARLGLVSFGGAITMARRLLVETYHWLSPAEFNDVIGLGQVLPGPNVVNASVIVGERAGGPLGALASLTGILLPPLAVVVGAAAILARYADSASVQHALHGGALAGAGLIVATGCNMASRLRGAPAIALAVAALALLAIAGWPLPLIVGILVPAGCITIVAVRRARR